MRRLSNIFLKINMIMGFVFIGLWTLLAVIFFVVAGLSGYIPEAANAAQQGGATVHGDPEYAAIVLRTVFIVIGVFFILFALFAIPSAVLSSKARNSTSKGTFIAVIILSALSLTEFGIAGGIIGIIATNKEAKSNIIDAK